MLNTGDSQVNKTEDTNQDEGAVRNGPSETVSAHEWISLETAAALAGVEKRTARKWAQHGSHGVVAKKNERGEWDLRRDTIPTNRRAIKPGRPSGTGTGAGITELVRTVSELSEKLSAVANRNGYLESEINRYKEIETRLLPEAQYTADQARQDAAIAEAEAERALKEAAEQKAKAEQAQAAIDEAKKEVIEIKENLTDLESKKREAELLAEVKAKEAEEAQEKAKRMNAEINKVPTFLRRLFKIEDAA